MAAAAGRARSCRLRFCSGDRELTVGELLAETYTDGFLVLREGGIVTEQYFNGLTADAPIC